MLNSREIDALRADVAANCRAWLARCQAAGLPGMKVLEFAFSDPAPCGTRSTRSTATA